MPLLTQLNTLESSGLIRLAAVQPELEYLFRHALVQDAAYGSLLKTDRRQLHLATCAALEKLYPDQTDDLAATLAYHYEKAEDNERAAHNFQRAGDFARDRYANVEALAFYQSAIRLVTATNELIETQRSTLAQLYEDAGDLLEIFGQHEAAREQFDCVLALLPCAEIVRRARVLRKEANTWMLQRQVAVALETFAKAETALGQVRVEAAEAWHQEWIQIQLERIWIFYMIDNSQELGGALNRVQPILEQYGRLDQRSRFFTCRLLLAYRLQRFVASPTELANAKAALDAALESGDLRGIATAYFYRGMALLLADELTAALENLQACLEIVERVGDLTTEIRCLTYVIAIHRRQRHWEAMRPLLPRLVKAAEDGQMKEYLATAWANNAYLSWRDGRFAEAFAESQAALDVWKQVPFGYPFQWQALWTLLGLSIQQDQIAEAIGYARQLLSPPERAQPANLHERLSGSIEAWEASQYEAARQHLETAIQQAQTHGYL